MAAKFTDEQLKAIQTTEKSVLVSAAAGSGKTAVLVERIIGIILDGKADVDEMLVVTFTNAAASEMRLRLASAIRARMAAHPEDAPRLKAQLAKLYKAYISTINSFSLRVIREFFHLLDTDPGFSVADDVRAELLKREAVNELFEDAFEDDTLIEGGSFRAFLRLYSEERSEESFKDSLIEAYNKLRSMPDYFEWAYEKAELLRVTEETFEGSELWRIITDDAAEAFSRAAEAIRRVRRLFEDAGLYDLYENKLMPREEAILDIHQRLAGEGLTRDVISCIDSIPAANVRASKAQKEAFESIKADQKALRDIYKEEIEGFKNRYLVPDLGTRLSEMNATFEYTLYYLRLLEEFERRYDEKKKERRLMDFSDQEHYAVKILKNEDAAEILRNRFKYIFVDEYQDTNNIQEHLIGRIARPGNVFRVGDVKQSIYRFRQAEPDIFERLYKRYSAGEDESAVAIDLSRNFRTNDRTIRYINHVFSHLMEGYDERAMLYTGLECEDKYDFMPEVHILTEEGSDIDEYAAGIEPEDRPDTGDDETEELSKEEAEAAYIAGLAASIIGTEFYDTKARKVRKAEARDIAILFRAVRYRGEVMSRALRERGIEPHIEENEEYFSTVEIETALALLTAIDNMKRDVPLIATLHSEIFSFDPGELAAIRLAYEDRRSAFSEAFGWYVSDGPDALLRNKAKSASEKLLEWRKLSRMMPLADFVWRVLVDSGYYRMAGAMPGGAMRQANLRSLADRAARFSKDSVANLSSFIGFLEVLKSRKLSNGQTPTAGKDDNVIRISTIHKSKGLEYPFVIVGGLGHRFRYDSLGKAFSFDSGVGVGLPYIDPERRYWRSTPVQRAINSKSRLDSYKEELRLLYVAMTRARNKLYMVGTVKSEEDLSKYTARPASFMKAMNGVVKSPYNRYHIEPLSLKKCGAPKNSAADIRLYEDKPLSPEEQDLYNEIDRRFRYRYPYEDFLTAKAKYSVSEIRGEETERIPLRNARRDDISSNAARGRLSASDIGTAYHRIMEFIDFSKVTDADGNIDEAYIAGKAAFLYAHGAIDQDIYETLDLAKIAAFFADEIGQRAIAADRAGRLRKEKPFTLRTKRGGRDIMVQGVIDCCFEEDGNMILVDYKSGYVDRRRPREEEIARIRDEYKVQTELYSEAINKGTGLEVSEIYLYLFTTSESVNML